MIMLFLTSTQALVQAAAPSFSETLWASFRDAFSMILSAIPRILGFIIVVAVGWFVSSILARAVMGLLKAIRFDELMQKSGLSDFTNKMGTGTDAAGIVAGLVKWLVRIVVLLVAFDVLGLPAVSDVMRQLLLWLPNLVVAIFVLFIGGVWGRALGQHLGGGAAGRGVPHSRDAGERYTPHGLGFRDRRRDQSARNRDESDQHAVHRVCGSAGGCARSGVRAGRA